MEKSNMENWYSCHGTCVSTHIDLIDKEKEQARDYTIFLFFAVVKSQCLSRVAHIWFVHINLSYFIWMQFLQSATLQYRCYLYATFHCCKHRTRRICNCLLDEWGEWEDCNILWISFSDVSKWKIPYRTETLKHLHCCRLTAIVWFMHWNMIPQTTWHAYGDTKCMRVAMRFRDVQWTLLINANHQFTFQWYYHQFITVCIKLNVVCLS